jgi:hypothetical protein
MKWKELLYDEIHNKEINNINGLLAISYQFFNSHASVANALFWYLKICFYTGRVGDTVMERFIQFNKDKRDTLRVILNERKIHIGQNLLQIGHHYPKIIKVHFEFINTLYQDDHYRDFLDDIFFDAAHYNLMFTKKSEISPTKIRNTEFLPILIEKVFDSFLINSQNEIADSNSPNYYSRRIVDTEFTEFSNSKRWHFDNLSG